MKKVFYNICIFAVIFILAGISLMFMPFFNITNIEVTGNKALTEQDIITTVGLDNETNLMAFNPFSAKKSLKSNPYVNDVTFTKSFPRTLKINLDEHKVRGYVPYMGNYLYINDNGLILDIQPTFTEQLPVVIGLDFSDFTLGKVLKVNNTETFTSVVELSKLFTKYEMLGDIIRVDVSEPDNIHLYVDKVDVIFGDFTDSNQKILTLNEILPKLDTATPGILDISDINTNPTFEFLT